MATPVVYEGISGFEAHVGEHLGYSDWRQVTQQEIDLFADATGDHQWIHVDPEKAATRALRQDHRARLSDACRWFRFWCSRSTK